MSRLRSHDVIVFPQECRASINLAANIIQLSFDHYQVVFFAKNSVVGNKRLERKKLWRLNKLHVRCFIDQCPCFQTKSMLKITHLFQHIAFLLQHTPLRIPREIILSTIFRRSHIFVIIDIFQDGFMASIWSRTKTIEKILKNRKDANGLEKSTKSCQVIHKITYQTTFSFI